MPSSCRAAEVRGPSPARSQYGAGHDQVKADTEPRIPVRRVFGSGAAQVSSTDSRRRATPPASPQRPSPERSLMQRLTHRHSPSSPSSYSVPLTPSPPRSGHVAPPPQSAWARPAAGPARTAATVSTAPRTAVPAASAGGADPGTGVGRRRVRTRPTDQGASSFQARTAETFPPFRSLLSVRRRAGAYISGRQLERGELRPGTRLCTNIQVE